MLGLQITATGLNPPSAIPNDLGHAGILENTSARCCDGCGKAGEIPHRIELSLIPKSQCADGFKRQWRICEHIGRETKSTRGFRLCFDFPSTLGVACIDVSVLWLEIAINTELVNPAAYLFDAAPVGVCVELCVSEAKFFDQIPVNQRVLGGYFGR